MNAGMHFFWNGGDRLAVLAFGRRDTGPLNGIDIVAFEHFLAVVSRHLRAMPLCDAAWCLRAGNLPTRAFSLSFEGACREWVTQVVPLLQRLALPATFHVDVEAVRSGQCEDSGSYGILLIEELRSLRSMGFSIGVLGSERDGSPRDAATSWQKFARDREWLDEQLGKEPRSLALETAHRDLRLIDLVQQAGFACALTREGGVATDDTSLAMLPRVFPSASDANQPTRLLRHTLSRPASGPWASDQNSRKLLMVAFHFPPQAGSSGILRSLNFVRYLPSDGWQPTVLTAQPRAYEEQRNDLIPRIPMGTRVLRAFALDAARHLAFSGQYMRLAALPDRWSSWWIGGVWRGWREIRRHRPDVLWSTYPNYTAHCIGATLSWISGVPWVADFRDPMTYPGQKSDRLQRWAWNKIEAMVMRRAAACVFTSERAAQTLGMRYPRAVSKCLVIENGYDEDSFREVDPGREGMTEGSLLLLHSGVIYPRERDPSTFFEAISRLLEEGVLEREHLCLRFRAPKHGQEVREVAARYGLDDVVDIAPPVPYREAIAEMMRADLLLVFQGTSFNAQIPAKVYEYLRAQRPIMAIIDPRGDVASLLSGFGAVVQGDIRDASSLQEAVKIWLNMRGTPLQQQALAENLARVQLFSRQSQTARLAKLLDACVGRPPA